METKTIKKLPKPRSAHEAAKRVSCRAALLHHLESGGPNQPDEMGCGPLHHACSAGNSGVARYLLERGADPNLADRFGRTPLHGACSAESEACVRLLIKAGAHIDIKNRSGVSPADLTNKPVLLRLLGKSDGRERA